MKKIMEQYFSSSELALIGKDFADLWRSRVSRPFLILVPLILAFAIPLVFLVAICLIPDGFVLSSDFSNLIPEYLDYTTKQKLYCVFVEMITPMLFVLIPIVIAAFTSIFLFVGERESETMESLIYSPLSASEIIKAKSACVIINSVIITLVSLICITIISSAGNVILSVPFFFNLDWVIIVFLLTPASICLSMHSMILLTRKHNTLITSISAGGYAGIPFVILFLCQFAGLLYVSAWTLFFLSLIIACVDVVLYFMKFRHISDGFLNDLLQS